MTSTKYDCSQGSATVGRWEGVWSRLGTNMPKEPCSCFCGWKSMWALSLRNARADDSGWFVAYSWLFIRLNLKAFYTFLVLIILSKK